MSDIASTHDYAVGLQANSKRYRQSQIKAALVVAQLNDSPTTTQQVLRN